MAQMRAVKADDPVVLKRTDVEELHALLAEVSSAKVLPEEPQTKALHSLGILHLALGLPPV